ncbi:ParB N-terminal domain-containing protein [Comamonas sp. JC664]|uniref:ParB/RepB/Spo0J family partition protein n=1 Tax=Comamonas sp. JC664 TaxID=2801917 RepID=UPI001749F738|nr:ParB N-terminal domain-containing protein [Comamonas sp. JC664]MBL0696654.1 ParB N-terminal domain-containing protein [Comamonas sp. JC664]GHG85341.1 hypothetical protein GCM10012319_41850 [Comamonas sp. KCTC 72670]
MDAEHRVDGQDGTAGAGPEGGSQASSGQDGAQASAGEGSHGGAASEVAQGQAASAEGAGQGGEGSASVTGERREAGTSSGPQASSVEASASGEGSAQAHGGSQADGTQASEGESQADGTQASEGGSQARGGSQADGTQASEDESQARDGSRSEGTQASEGESQASDGSRSGSAPSSERGANEAPRSDSGASASDAAQSVREASSEGGAQGHDGSHAASAQSPEGSASTRDGSKEQTDLKEGGLQAGGDALGAGAPPAEGESHAQGEHRAVSESQGQDGSESSEARADGGPDAAGKSPDAKASAESEGVAPGLNAPPHGAFWTGESDSSADASSEEGSDDAQPDVLDAPEERLAGRVTTVLLSLDKLEDDNTFKLRPEGDVSGLATDIARLGQLFPVDVRPAGEDRYQLVCGFRRVAALRFLKRDAVQARIHLRLTDEDALVMSLAEAIHATPVGPEVLEAKRDELEAQGRLSAAVRDMLEKALATEDTLAPEGVEEEIDADEMAQEVAERLGAINQDLSLLADVFAALDESRKAELLMQLRYSSQLVTYLEGL